MHGIRWRKLRGDNPEAAKVPAKEPGVTRQQAVGAGLCVGANEKVGCHAARRRQSAFLTLLQVGLVGFLNDRFYCRLIEWNQFNAVLIEKPIQKCGIGGLRR